MQCRDFREVADSYLSDELLVETNHDVIAHLEACNDCRNELAARRELRATLRTSFANAEELRVDDEFAARLRDELRATASSQAMPPATRRRALMAIAACLLVITTLALIVVWRRSKTSPQLAAREQRDANVADIKPHPTPGDDAAYDANVLPVAMSELAAGDHRNCAINHRLPQSPIPLEEAARRLDRAYLDLTKVVTSDEAIEIVMAHACMFQGRWFAHVVVRHNGHLVSLLVTQLEQTDSLPATQTHARIARHNQVIACSRVGDYQISCFRTSRHAVFVVSDLSEAENLAVARTLARPVYEHIAKAENVT
jgi:hypothetical protein